MDANWKEIVGKALDDGVRVSNGAVPGARLRQLIAKVALDEGVAFPPEGMESFGRFLDEFPDVALVQRRPGRDMLVVPAKNAELLTVGTLVPQLSVIRRDMFEALTKITKVGEFRPLYLRNTDSVLWPEQEQVPDDAVALPEATLDQAVVDRREFAAQGYVESRAREEIIASLGAPSPLFAFSEVVRANGLARRWHQFRAGVILNRLQAWSQQSGVAWHPSWLVDAETAAELAGTAPTSTGLTGVEEFFVTLAKVLREGDLARISIPLDLVLRARNRG